MQTILQGTEPCLWLEYSLTPRDLGRETLAFLNFYQNRWRVSEAAKAKNLTQGSKILTALALKRELREYLALQKTNQLVKFRGIHPSGKGS
jgi:hypothetical protein